MINQRIRKLQTELTNPLLIKKKENLLYLTGEDFSHVDGFLLVNPRMNTNKKQMNTDVVFFGSGLEKVRGIKTVDRLKNIAEYLKPKSKLDIEYGFTYGEGEYLKAKLQTSKSKVGPVRSAVDVMRTIKEPEEIAKIKKSMQIVERVFNLVRKEIKKPGMTEVRLAQFIQSSGLKMGAHDVSFPAIVAAGPNAAVPHHQPSKKLLKSGESIILDFGFKYKNYCSDFTRTVFLKTVPKKLETAYNQTEKAYKESMDFCNLSVARLHSRHLSLKGERRPSPFKESGRGEVVTGDAVYQKSVDVLAEKNLDKYFIHSLGHGTGLEIHELPNISPGSKDILKNGMVFSIEPGVYLPKLGGIRIEDLVYLENSKVKKFINVSTKLENNIF